jgi:hypothetical protein
MDEMPATLPQQTNGFRPPDDKPLPVTERSISVPVEIMEEATGNASIVATMNKTYPIVFDLGPSLPRRNRT